jgi:drug/metabolite transporter (DMT)-like permease
VRRLATLGSEYDCTSVESAPQHPPLVDMSGYAPLGDSPAAAPKTPAEVRVWGVRQSILVQVGLLTAQLINAAYNVMAQHMLTKDGADPLVFSVYRDLAAAPLLSMAAVGLEGSRMPAVAHLPRIAAQGFLGVFCNQVLFLVGVQMTNATVASIVNLTLPVFAAVLALLLGMEAFNWSTAAGLLLAVAGAMFIQAGGGSVPLAFNIGVGVIALGALTSAVYFIIQKSSLAHYPPVSMTAWEYWVGFGCMGLAAGACVRIATLHLVTASAHSRTERLHGVGTEGCSATSGAWRAMGAHAQRTGGTVVLCDLQLWYGCHPSSLVVASPHPSSHVEKLQGSHGVSRWLTVSPASTGRFPTSTPSQLAVAVTRCIGDACPLCGYDSGEVRAEHVLQQARVRHHTHSVRHAGASAHRRALRRLPAGSCFLPMPVAQSAQPIAEWELRTYV